MKKVSILIPLYNGEQFIKKTIESSLKQTWGNKEIIVVDDGSSDNGIQIVQEFAHQGVKLFQQGNKGASVARNVAFEKSTGDYIQYLDADDLLDPEKIELQMQVFAQFGDDYLTSCSWGRFISEPTETKFEQQALNNDLDSIEWLVTAWENGEMMQTACWLTPRYLIEQSGGWDDSLIANPNDDGEFFSRVILKSKGVKFYEDAKVYYRSGLRDSLSQTHSKEAVNSLYSTLESYQKSILALEDSPRARHACMKNYLKFIYQFHPKNPELLAKSKEKIRDLGFHKLEPTGGKYAKIVSSIIGFENMLTVRSWIK